MLTDTPTEFISIDDCREGLIAAVQQLDTMASCVAHGDVVFDQGHALSTNLFVTAARQAATQDDCQNLISSMFLDECRKLDAAVGYASLAFIDAVKHGVTMHRDDDVLQSSAVAADIKRFARPADIDTVRRAIKHCAHVLRADRLGDIVTEALTMGGLRGKIETVKSTSAPHDTVELTCGCAFGVDATKTVDASWSKPGVTCLIVDGVIEDVAEIDAVLTGAVASKRPLLLVCRGCAQDVASTVIHNRRRGTLDAHIAIVPFDAIGANMLKDIAAVCKSDVVSSMRGQTTSAVRYQSLPVVDRVTLDASRLVIVNDAQQEIEHHLAQLLKSKTNTPADDVIDRRISSLLDTKVVVTLSGDARESQSKAELVDMLLRSARTLLSHGIVDYRALLETVTHIGAVELTMLERVIMSLVDAHGTCPAAMCLVAYVRASELVKLFTGDAAGIIKLSG